MSHFHPLEIVDRGSRAQLYVDENFKLINLSVYVSTKFGSVYCDITCSRWTSRRGSSHWFFSCDVLSLRCWLRCRFHCRRHCRCRFRCRLYFRCHLCCRCRLCCHYRCSCRCCLDLDFLTGACFCTLFLGIIPLGSSSALHDFFLASGATFIIKFTCVTGLIKSFFLSLTRSYTIWSRCVDN